MDHKLAGLIVFISEYVARKYLKPLSWAPNTGAKARGAGLIITDRSQARSSTPASIMVTADSLNFDVLELIFSYLSGQDLASVAQVNKSFLAGALPRLYKNVWYRLREGKGYASVRRSFCPHKSVKANP